MGQAEDMAARPVVQSMRYVALYVSADGLRRRTYPQRSPEPIALAIRTEDGEVFTLKMVQHVPEVTDAEVEAAHARSDDADRRRMEFNARMYGGSAA